ncbi:hypothetical protein DM02DRAFT_349092 [Periconia macrospinosa]|uniref:2EXR domain-containing protein n=1 Tax=Periconia macrospinosa TaxID=97972 RepID=A0A2V1DT28_9PLEO|nr:hypothetical protein DM02DRAFT_349092 [Periconia macrospinosa]
MATFHLFPRLPLELRIQIWALATADRIVHVNRCIGDVDGEKGFWSPDLPPGVTRACRESRTYCNYRKAFILERSPRYVWVNFEYDTIQMRGMILCHIYEPNEKENIRNLRAELIDDVWQVDEVEAFIFYNIHYLLRFSQLNDFVVVETRNSVSRVTKRYIRAPKGERKWIGLPDGIL